MNLDYSEKFKLKINMVYFTDIIIEESPYEMKEQSKSPWIDKLVKANDLDNKLDEARQQIYTHFQ